MTIGWPMFCDTWSSTTRPVVLDALPAANGLITRIGRVGHCCARAATVAATRTAAVQSIRKIIAGNLLPDYVATDRHCLPARLRWVTRSLRKRRRRPGVRHCEARSAEAIQGPHVVPWIGLCLRSS